MAQAVAVQTAVSLPTDLPVVAPTVLPMGLPAVARVALLAMVPRVDALAAECKFHS